MKYTNLIILMILIVIWSLFFAIYKYYIWWIFWNTDTITLQYISGYLGMWTLFAYIVWWLFYEIFKEKKYHFFIILFTLIWFLSVYFIHNKITDYILVAWLTLFIWFFYWLWGVLRNILISTQIQETWLWDTKINWMANIFFITSIILWSIFWWIISEKFNLNWIFYISILLFVWLIFWCFMKYNNNSWNTDLLKNAIIYKNNFKTDFTFIIKRYSIIMLFIWLLLTIATILSQKAIEYSVDNLWKSGSEAAMILLYSAVWSIVWNIISMKIKNNRWNYFLVFSICFSIVCSLFPTFIDNFNHSSILALVAGLFFWINYNLLESYFFKKIADDDKKSYWASSLWIFTSLVLSAMMFLVDFIWKIAWFSWVCYFMWIILFLIWIIIFFNWKKMEV